MDVISVRPSSVLPQFISASNILAAVEEKDVATFFLQVSPGGTYEDSITHRGRGPEFSLRRSSPPQEGCGRSGAAGPENCSRSRGAPFSGSRVLKFNTPPSLRVLLTLPRAGVGK